MNCLENAYYDDASVIFLTSNKNCNCSKDKDKVPVKLHIAPSISSFSITRLENRQWFEVRHSKTGRKKHSHTAAVKSHVNRTRVARQIESYRLFQTSYFKFNESSSKITRVSLSRSLIAQSSLTPFSRYN